MSPAPKRKALLSSFYLQGVILQFNKTFSAKTVYFEIDNINNNKKNMIYFIKLKTKDKKIRVEKAMKQWKFIILLTGPTRWDSTLRLEKKTEGTLLLWALPVLTHAWLSLSPLWISGWWTPFLLPLTSFPPTLSNTQILRPSLRSQRTRARSPAESSLQKPLGEWLILKGTLTPELRDCGRRCLDLISTCSGSQQTPLQCSINMY